MHEVENKAFGRYFTSSLIAAVPYSDILRQAFNTLGEIVITGKNPYEKKVNLFLWNTDLSVGYVENSLEASINLVFYNIKATKGE